jgi:proteasome accessory factor B
MAAERTERLINLVICLLHTRSFLTAERLREIIPGYSDAASDEAFKRDKEDLRDLGIPLETGSLSGWEDEVGYRIGRNDYALPDITFEPDEAAAVGLAARVWSSAAMSGPVTRALRKLEATGVEITPMPEGLQPGVGAVSGGLPAVDEAIRTGRRVRFDYRGASDNAPATRRVEPWGVVRWHGRWYLVGHDLDREAPRAFRLSRMTTEPKAEGPAGVVNVPQGIDLPALVSESDPPGAAVLARVKVRRDRAIGLRRQAVDQVDGGDGWEILSLPYADSQRLADQILGYGADVVVLSPAEARDTVVRRLQALVEAGQ